MQNQINNNAFWNILSHLCVNFWVTNFWLNNYHFLHGHPLELIMNLAKRILELLKKKKWKKNLELFCPLLNKAAHWDLKEIYLLD